MKLYEVIHNYTTKDGYDKYIYIGVFDTKESAKRAVKKLQKKKVFKRKREKFLIQKVIVDPDILPWDMGHLVYKSSRE